MAENSVTIQVRWRRPLWLWIGEALKWPTQVLLLFGYRGRCALYRWSDFILRKGGCEIRFESDGEWMPIIEHASTCTNASH